MLDFVWFTGPADWSLGSNNDKALHGVTLDFCKAACIAETEFVCLSLDYGIGSTCLLSMATKNLAPPEWRPYASYTYYERQCPVT